MAGWLTGDQQPGGSIAPPAQPLGLSPDLKQPLSLTSATPRPQVAASAAPSLPDVAYDALSPFTIGNARPDGQSPITGIAPEYAGALAKMVADMPPEIQQRFRIESGYRSAEREEAVNPSVGYGRSEHTNRYAADLTKDPAVLQWITQNGQRYGVGFPLAGDPKEINHLEYMPNGQRMPIARMASMEAAGGPKMRDLWNTPFDASQVGELPPQLQELYKERQAKTEQVQGALAGKLAEYQRVANTAPAGSKELDAAVSELRKASADDRAAYRNMIMHPPIQKPVDAFANFGSAATLIAMLGGLLSRQHATTALGAAGEAMKAINSNNADAYEKSFKTWQTQADMAHTLMSMENEDIRSLLEDKRMSVDERTTKLQNLVAETGMVKTIGGMSLDNLDHIADFYEKRVNATLGFKSQTEALKLQAAYTARAQYLTDHPGDVAGADAAAMRAMSAGASKETQSGGREADVQKAIQAKDEKWKADNPNATKDEIAAAHFQHRTEAERDLTQATHAPRSAPAMFMQKVLQEHPDADSEALAMAAARYRQLGAMEQAFGSGAQGNTIRSLNVAIDHTDVLRQLGDALKNGDTQRLNALRNRLLVEFGYEGPVDFDVAKKIVGDEVVKAVLGSNAGTGFERAELQAAFDRANSPEQLNGVIETARRLMLGQMRGLEFQYAGSDEKRRVSFRDKLFEHTKDALESTDRGHAAGGATGVPSDLPSPSGHAEGSTAKDASGKVVAKIVGGKWSAP